MAFAGDIGGNLKSVGQAHAGNLAQGGIRFLGGSRTNYGADTPFLRRACVHAITAILLGIQGIQQSRGFALRSFGLATFADQLVDCWHLLPPEGKTGRTKMDFSISEAIALQ
jgi:hypothetical protein